MFKSYPFPPLHWSNLASYGWILFIIGGLLIAIRRTWSLTMYIFVGVLFILYDIFILGVLAFFGFLMNDMNTPITEVIRGLLAYLIAIIPYAFYWLASMLYIAKIKEQ